MVAQSKEILILQFTFFVSIYSLISPVAAKVNPLKTKSRWCTLFRKLQRLLVSPSGWQGPIGAAPTTAFLFTFHPPRSHHSSHTGCGDVPLAKQVLVSGSLAQFLPWGLSSHCFLQLEWFRYLSPLGFHHLLTMQLDMLEPHSDSLYGCVLPSPAVATIG